MVVGGGKVASRKAARLLESGADVTIIAPEASPEIVDLASQGRLRWLKREYVPQDLAGALLVFAATDSPEVNQRIAQDARSAGALANVASGASGDFLVPSMVRRGDLVVAIGTGGASPEVARRLRIMLEEEIGPEYAQWLEMMADLREELKPLGLDDATWQALWRHLAEIDVLQYLKRAQYRRARNVLWNAAAKYLDAVESQRVDVKEQKSLGDLPPGVSASVAVVIAAHGSTVAGAQEEMERLVREVQGATGYRTVVGYLFGEPKVADVAESCIAEGATRVLIVPYFLSAGVHVRKDLPEIASGIAKAHPNVEVRLGKPLAGHPLLRDVVVARIEELSTDRTDSSD